MKVSEVVEALASKYSFSAEEAQEYLRTLLKKPPKLKIVDEAPKLKSILCKSYSKRQILPNNVKFEYGMKWDEHASELEEYQAPQEVEETNEKYPLLLCEK